MMDYLLSSYYNELESNVENKREVGHNLTITHLL